MKRILLATALLASLPAMAAEKPAEKPAARPTASIALPKDDDKAAYSIGYFTGKANAQHLDSLNVDAYVAGFRDAYAKKDPALTEDEMKATLEAFKQKLSAEAYAKAKKEADENKAKSAAYMAENGKKAGVTTTASGLQYEVLTQGTGAKPKASDTVEQLIVADLNLDLVQEVRNTWQFYRDRRPEMYGDIKAYSTRKNLRRVY